MAGLSWAVLLLVVSDAIDVRWQQNVEDDLSLTSLHPQCPLGSLSPSGWSDFLGGSSLLRMQRLKLLGLVKAPSGLELVQWHFTAFC